MNGVEISSGIAIMLVSGLGAFMLIALSAVLIIIHRAHKYDVSKITDSDKAVINTAEIIDLARARHKQALKQQ